MSWTKEADWLPISSAIAQVRFWKDDLRQAEQELKLVQEQILKYPTLDLSHLEAEAVEDVTESRDALVEARLKLNKTLERVKNG